MLFPTFDYFLFLPLVAAVHWLLRGVGLRTGWLLLCSAIFYAAWNPLDSLLLGFIIAAAYLGARWSDSLPLRARGLPMAVTISILITPLFYCKYIHFLGSTLQLYYPDAPIPPEQRLPIGISFYTFQAIAYVVDVYRGQKVERDPLKFTTFLMFFPHLVAGPILRASVLLEQLSSPRTLLRSDVGEAVFRLCQGLIKKVLIADVLRIGMVDSVIADPSAFTALEVMVALYAYTLQIYCDFSGYTDFAIGSARLLGFHIPENFDRPYQALSVGEYWRRWHITLSDWVRDYVYYPIGGSRVGGWRAYRNTFVTLLILAVWHGANWTFLLYGFLHACAISLHRFSRNVQKAQGEISRALPWHGIAWRWFLTFHFVVLARILFRADDIHHASDIAAALLQPVEWVMPRFALQSWSVLLLGYAVHLSPRPWLRLARERFALLPTPLQGLALAAAGAACVRWGPSDALSFIYYSF